MAWSARITSTRDNPVPNGTGFINVEFTDGGHTFTREFKIVSGGQSAQEIVDQQLLEVATFYAQMAALPSIVVENVPQTVSNFQARAVLIQMGLYETVNAAISKMGGIELAAWEYSPNVHRQSPLVLALATQLKLSSEQVDQMFIAASNIAV